MFALVLVANGSIASAAPDRTIVALHPTEVVDTSDTEAARVHAQVAIALARRGAELTPSEDVVTYLRTLPHRGCADLIDADRRDCLGKLAKNVGANRTIPLTVAPYAGSRVVIT